MFTKLIARLILTVFLFTSVGPLPDASAQSIIDLPAPGHMVDFSPKFNKATLKGIIFHPENPFKFDFILDEGDAHLNKGQAKAQSQKIAAYFLASLTTPEKEIWVNLSPFEKNRIVPEFFGKTLMGQNLLAQDYMLKQIMATALYPERQLGREFWQKIYKQALIKFGTTNIPFNTFNKVWIVPDKAVVYENTKMNAVFVADSSLKVMLEKDYLAANKNKFRFNTAAVTETGTGTLSAAVIKELVIPALEKEVNEGKNFAPLRQVYNSLILAKWYKDHLRNNIIAKGYIDRNKIKGIDSRDKQRVSEIYDQYLRAYKKGVFNFIKEDFDEASQSIVPRKYFSGGFFGGALHEVTTTNKAMAAAGFRKKNFLIARVFLALTLISTAQPVLAQAQQIYQQSVAPQDLSIIRGAAYGSGDPTAAAQAFNRLTDERYFSDDSLDEYAALCLSLSKGGSYDKALDILTNTTMSFPNISAAVPVSILNLIGNFVLDLKNANNVTSQELRLAAAKYLLTKYTLSNQVPSSTLMQRFFQTGIFERLINTDDPNASVEAARLMVVALMVQKGGASGGFLSSHNISGLAHVQDKLHDPRRIVARAAALVFLAIPKSSGYHQDMISKYLSETPQPNDLTVYNTMLSAARNQNMPVAASVSQSIQDFIQKNRPTDTVGSQNWIEQVRHAMEGIIALSGGNRGNLFDNIDLMAKECAGNQTDVLNYYKLGMVFFAVQQGALTEADFNNVLAQFRQAYTGLPSTPVRIMPLSGDLKVYLQQLQNSEDPQGNVQRILSEGGPFYLPFLYDAIRDNEDPQVIGAIAANLPVILAMGVNNNVNKWYSLMNSKLKGDYGLEKKALAALPVIAVQLRPLVNDIIAHVFSMPNPAGNSLNVSSTYWSELNFDARLVAKYQGDWREMVAGFNDSTGFTQGQFMAAINNAPRNVPVAARPDNSGGGTAPSIGYTARPRAAVSGGPAISGGGSWESAEKTFLGYLRGEGSITAESAARAIDEADSVYKRPSDTGSGEAIMNKYIEQYSNPAYLIRMADVFLKLSNKKLAFELLSGLLNRNSMKVDEIVIKSFIGSDQQKGVTKDQTLKAAPRIVETYLSYVKNRNLQNPVSLKNEYQMGSSLRSLGIDALQAAIDDKLSSVDISEPERLALQDLGKEASSPEYTDYIIAITNPNIFDPKLTEVLTRLASMHLRFPGMALYDLHFILKNSPNFEDQGHRVLLQRVIASAEKQLGGVILNEVKNKEVEMQYLDEFRNAPGAVTQSDALRLFLNAPPEMAANLFWEGVNVLAQRPTIEAKKQRIMYPNFTNDPLQLSDFMDVLRSMRDLIQDLKKTDAVKYNVIVNHLRGNLEHQIRSKRFEDGVQYVFLKSIDPQLVAGINMEINPSTDTHFLNVPPQMPIWVEGGHSIPGVYAELASTLNMVPQKISAVPADEDPLKDLEDLLDPTNAVRQMAAIARLRAVTLLFQNDIHCAGPEVRTFLLYHGDQYQVLGENSQMMLTNTEGFTNQDWILYMAQLSKRGADAWRQALHYLQDKDFIAHHPEAFNELVNAIGNKKETDMVWPLLHAYVDNELDGYTVYGVGFRGSYVGTTIEKNIVRIGRAPGHQEEVIAKINSFINAMDPGFKNNVVFIPVFKNLIKEISRPDNAMAAIPNGGIDLENVVLQSKGTGEIKTAFDDKAQLDVLLKSEGLVPVIENVKPLTQTAINHLLGSI